jgi:hypothetical protein
MTSFSMKERTVSRICRSSSLSEKSTIGLTTFLRSSYWVRLAGSDPISGIML